MTLDIMQHTKHFPPHFWAEAINMACHIPNCLALVPWYVCPNYETWRWRKPINVKYYHKFDNTCYIVYQ